MIPKQITERLSFGNDDEMTMDYSEEMLLTQSPAKTSPISFSKQTPIHSSPEINHKTVITQLNKNKQAMTPKRITERQGVCSTSKKKQKML